MNPDNIPLRCRERQQVDSQRIEKGHLPRRPPEYYRGRAFVRWTLTLEHRATGWLTPEFHWRWQLLLLHTSARYRLVCPTYVLMPDHAHVLWLGLEERGSDQRLAIEFLRKTSRPHLAPADWQRQPYDHVLTEAERARGAFRDCAHYIFENPVRANLVSDWQNYPNLGCCVPGYPEFDPRESDY